MANKNNIKNTIDYLQSISDTSLTSNESKISSLSNESNTSSQPIIIKVLIIIGAILTCVFSLASLLILGIYENTVAMIALGSILILGSIYLTSQKQAVFLDALLLSFYCAGYGLLGIGLYTETESTTILSIAFIALSSITILFSKNYIIIFSSLLILFGAIKVLLFQISPALDGIYFCLIALLMVYVILHEAKFLTWNKQSFRIYDPARIALIVYLVILFTPLNYQSSYGQEWSKFESLLIDYSAWIRSIFLILLLIFITSKILNVMEVHSSMKKRLIYLGIILLLLPTVIQPGIATSITILLVCFYVNYKTGFAIGIISFLYFISRYYYDMDITLLSKSLTLIASGILFLLLYHFTNPYLSKNEED